jgi:hypothetical protein
MFNNTVKCQLVKNCVSLNERFLTRYLNFLAYCKTTNPSGYTEKHHIVPKSFGGNDSKENIIKLSARQHYIAHFLLAKATGNPKMIKALHKMVYSTTGDVQRDYKISSRVYSYVREEHSKIVSQYSKNTVVARQIYTEEVKRIPKALFDKYNGILYEALAKGRKDREETRLKKSRASMRPRKVKQNSITRSIAASKYSYQTPKGFCLTSKELSALYPSFTKNTLCHIGDDVIITKKFALIHPDFADHVGQSFKDYGLLTIERKKHVKN